jgi:flagellar hook-length control protein FliK
VRAAITAPGTSDLSVPADSHAVPGIARTILAAAGHQSRAGSSVPTPRDSVGTETGLPAITLPMIAAAIEDEIARAVPARPDAVGNHADPATGTAPDGPLRVLRIQLRPEELGTVTVELRLANGQLETHLRASRPETAALLQRDAAILTDLLKQAHHQADVTVAQARPADAGGSAEGAPSQGQSSFANGGARPGHGEDGQRQAAHRSATGRRDGERIDETIRPRDGGIYL